MAAPRLVAVDVLRARQPVFAWLVRHHDILDDHAIAVMLLCWIVLLVGAVLWIVRRTVVWPRRRDSTSATSLRSPRDRLG